MTLANDDKLKSWRERQASRKKARKKEQLEKIITCEGQGGKLAWDRFQIIFPLRHLGLQQEKARDHWRGLGYLGKLGEG